VALGSASIPAGRSRSLRSLCAPNLWFSELIENKELISISLAELEVLVPPNQY
jgi:hypothetical protein